MFFHVYVLLSFYHLLFQIDYFALKRRFTGKSRLQGRTIRNVITLSGSPAPACGRQGRGASLKDCSASAKAIKCILPGPLMAGLG